MITGCYVAVQNLVWTLAHDFGTGALVLGVQIATLWRGGPNKNQRVKVRKPSSMFACCRGRCRKHLRLGRAAWVSRGRAVGISYFPTSPTNPFLCCQLLRASFLPRAFAAFDPESGSRGGALAQLFAESAIPSPDHPASNEPITTDSVEPMMVAMDHDAAPGDGAVFPRRLPARSSVASSCS